MAEKAESGKQIGKPRLRSAGKAVQKFWGFGLDDPRYTRWQTGLEITAEQFDALKLCIAEGNFTGRIIFDQNFNILDGRHAYRAFLELGTRPEPKQIIMYSTKGMTEANVKRLVLLWEFSRKHVSQEQRRQVIAELYRLQEGNVSVKEIERTTGFDKKDHSQGA